MKKIFIASILILIFFTIFPIETYGQGLVPCGGAGNPCKLCHFFVLLNNIWVLILKIVAGIAAITFTVGGIMFLFAGNNPAMLQSGKKVVTSTVIGLLIIFGSWMLVNTILTWPGFVSADFQNILSNWNKPDLWFVVSGCP